MYLKEISIFSDIPFEFHSNIPIILGTINELKYRYAQAYICIYTLHTFIPQNMCHTLFVNQL